LNLPVIQKERGYTSWREFFSVRITVLMLICIADTGVVHSKIDNLLFYTGMAGTVLELKAPSAGLTALALMPSAS
jgi:hypothetical protein